MKHSYTPELLMNRPARVAVEARKTRSSKPGSPLKFAESERHHAVAALIALAIPLACKMTG